MAITYKKDSKTGAYLADKDGTNVVNDIYAYTKDFKDVTT